MKTRYQDDKLLAAIGHIAILEEKVEFLTGELRAAVLTIQHLDHRTKFLEEHQKQLTRPRTLLTEKEAAEMLGVHIETMRKWRKEHPAPRIPFIQLEGGDVRYRAEAIESYLNSRERGAKSRALKAA